MKNIAEWPFQTITFRTCDADPVHSSLRDWSHFNFVCQFSCLSIKLILPKGFSHVRQATLKSESLAQPHPKGSQLTSWVGLLQTWGQSYTSRRGRDSIIILLSGCLLLHCLYRNEVINWFREGQSDQSIVLKLGKPRSIIQLLLHWFIREMHAINLKVTLRPLNSHFPTRAQLWRKVCCSSKPNLLFLQHESQVLLCLGASKGGSKGHGVLCTDSKGVSELTRTPF